MQAKILMVSSTLLCATLLGGCGAAVVAGAGAAGGYIAHKEGYRVQNPVTKSGKSTKKKETQP